MIPFNDDMSYDDAKQAVEERKGIVTVEDVKGLRRIKILKILRFLENWNSNQPVSDAEHSLHYKKYCIPIRNLTNLGIL